MREMEVGDKASKRRSDHKNTTPPVAGVILQGVGTRIGSKGRAARRIATRSEDLL